MKLTNRASFFLALFLPVIVSCEFTREKPVDREETTTELISAEPAAEVESRDIYGILESYEKNTHVIRRNESLSRILRNHGLSSRQIHDISKSSADIFDVRRMRAGRPLHLYFEPDSSGISDQPSFVIYEENKTDFVRFDIGDSISVTRDSKPVETTNRFVTGTITSSLYQTLRDEGVSPQLTHRLAEVFAWQVDFYRIQSGDHFQVLFEEKSMGGEVVDIGRIKAAVFHHRNNDYYAFHYRQNGMDEYFDEEGNSLRRQFMAAPLDYTRISSRFTNRRYHPVLRRNMPHHGTDYAAPTGTPIRAVGDGHITVSRYSRNNGNYIRIRHNSIYETGYLHMSRFADGIQPGKEVKQGEIIGYVGATGLATGPHLCFRFWKHGQPVDPQRIDLPPAEPIQSEHRAAFSHRKEYLLEQLDLDVDRIISRPIRFALNIGYDGVLSNISPESDSVDM